MNYIPTYAVVPSAGRDYVHECLVSLLDQVELTVVVANQGWVPPLWKQDLVMVSDPEPERNISRWWNLGLDAAQKIANSAEWNVLVVNDDVVASPDLVSVLSHELRSTSSVIAYPNQFNDVYVRWTDSGPVDLRYRLTGYAWMIRGESGLRLDESLKWWYGDDDLFWRANQAGGSVCVPGCRVVHQEPNGYTNSIPDLSKQAGLDRETFVKKWGTPPW